MKPSTPYALSPALSIYLDLVRFAAALTVFVAHFGLHRLSGGFLWQLNPYGHQAVTVFFVLSGFVIAYATDTRERDVRSYAISRLSRLYSVVVPAILLTVVLDTVGSGLRPDLYQGWGYEGGLSFLRFFTALTFTNQVWTLNVPQGSNLAYWSLGYEAAYYVIFGLAMFVRGRWRWPAVALALLAYGPSIVSALPIWLAGVFTYRWCRRGGISPRAGLWLFFGSVLAWLVYEALVWKLGRPMLQGSPLVRRRELVQDLFIALCFSANLLGMSAAAGQIGGLLIRWQTPIRWLAGATFTLYLCHESIGEFLLTLLPWPVADARSRMVVFFGTLALVFLLSMVTERRKQPWRHAFEALWPRRSLP